MATDFYLKIEGIDGESTADNMMGHIDVQSMSFGVTNPHQIGRVGEGLSAGRAQVQEIHFTKFTDKSSPKLFNAAATGASIPKATFFGKKSGGGVSTGKPMLYYQVTLENVLITNYQNQGSTHSELTESVSFGFSQIQFEYTEQKKDGSAGPKNQAKFDVVKNKQN